VAEREGLLPYTEAPSPMTCRRLTLTLVVCALALAWTATAGATPRITPRDEPLAAARSLAGGVRVVGPLAAPHSFNLVGLHWRGSGDVWFRTRAAGGAWSEWRAARPEGEDLPDPGSAESRARPGWTIGNPWWTGAAQEIQYRVAGSVSKLCAFFVWSPVRPTRRVAMAGTPGIVPRSGWDADEAIVRAAPLYAGDLALAIVHHTAGRAPASPGESAAIVRAIQTYHVKANGWNDIGYNFVVDPFGQVFEGRAGGIDRNVVGAHAEGFNTGSVGVAVIGTYDGGPPSPEAEAALEALIAWRLDVAHVDPITLVTRRSLGNPRFPEGIPVTLRAISGHRDTGFTECPGDALYGRLGNIAQAVAALGLPKLYEPVVSGAVGGPVQFSARLSDALPWTVTVTDAAGNAIVSGAGTGPQVSWVWDATSSSPGTYAYRIDAGPAVLPVVGTVGSGVSLDVTKLAAVPSALTPNGYGDGEESEIAFSLTAPATVSVSVLDAAGALVLQLVSEQSFPAGPVSVGWNGTMPDGAPAPDGRYSVVVLARTKKQEVTKATELVIDGAVGGLTLSAAAFSPNGDGRLDALDIGFDLNRPAQVRVRILGKKGSIVRVFAGELAGGGRQALAWNGTRHGRPARDGTYEVSVEVTTELGTRELRQVFAVDTTPPQVAIVAARTRAGATKLIFELSEPASVKIKYDRAAFTVDRPAGTVGFWQRLDPRRIRLVASDAAGNTGEPVVFKR